MQVQQLMVFVERADTHRRLLANYDGPYSLGVGHRAGDAVLVLQVDPQASATAFPDAIRLDGETVPLIVQRNFIVPQPIGKLG